MSKEDENEKGAEVTATEDLMREHGVLRRARLVYTAAAVKCALQSGEHSARRSPENCKVVSRIWEYHEKKLEEAFIFRQ